MCIIYPVCKGYHDIGCMLIYHRNKPQNPQIPFIDWARNVDYFPIFRDYELCAQSTKPSNTSYKYYLYRLVNNGYFLAVQRRQNVHYLPSLSRVIDWGRNVLFVFFEQSRMRFMCPVCEGYDMPSIVSRCAKGCKEGECEEGGKGLWKIAETLYHRDDALLYIAYVMLT